MRLRSAAVLPAYLLLSLILTWPLARHLDRAVPAGASNVDPLMQAYVLDWDTQALLERRGTLFDPPRFHPEPGTLAYMDHLIGEALVALPVRIAGGGLPLAYNVIFLASFALSGWATYRLLRTLGASRTAAFLAGVLFAFSPFRFANLGNLNQLQTQFLPLGLHFLARALRDGGARHLWGVALTFAAQAWFGWYGVFHLAIALLVLGVTGVGEGRPRWTPGFTRAALGAGVAAVLLILPVALPYLELQRALPGFRRTLGQATLYSADLLDYLRTVPWSPLGLFLPRGWQASWVGWTTAALAAAGVAGILRRRAAPAARRGPSLEASMGALAATGFVLSLGPVLQAAGRRLPIPLPFALLFVAVPGFAAMRAPGRFSILVLLAAVVVAARGFDALRAHPALRGARGRWLGPAALAVALAEAWVPPVPLADAARALPPAYAWLAARTPHGALLEIPMPARESEETERDAVRQLWGLAHRWPRVDGVSGFSSPAHERFRAAIQAFPDSAALSAATGRGVSRVMVRYGELEPGRREAVAAAARSAPRLAEVARFGDDVLYELRER